MYLNESAMYEAISKLAKVYNDYVRNFNKDCKDVEEYIPYVVISKSDEDPEIHG